jgi:hypothetical protein
MRKALIAVAENGKWCFVETLRNDKWSGGVLDRYNGVNEMCVAWSWYVRLCVQTLYSCDRQQNFTAKSNSCQALGGSEIPIFGNSATSGQTVSTCKSS